MNAEDHACDYYPDPEQDCLTAGMDVIGSEGMCGPCSWRLIESVRALHSMTMESIAYHAGRGVTTIVCRVDSDPAPCRTLALLPTHDHE